MDKVNLLFGSVWTASGAQGTFNLPGEYRHHWPHWLWNLLYAGTTFCAKTVTTAPNKGNTELRPDGFRVKHWFPDSIWITAKSWWQKYCLNCFGLSNQGVARALEEGVWQNLDQPFHVSWMPITDDPLDEAREFVRQMKLANFKIAWALQYNASCPNVGCDLGTVSEKIRAVLDVLRELEVPVLIKINAQFPVDLAVELQEHPACSGFVMGNTAPFGAEFPSGFPQIPWVKLFKTNKPTESPLAKRFNDDPKKMGGLSGKHLLPVVCHWIRNAREAGLNCHINAGGGIMGPLGARKAFKAGADSVSLGTISMFRPWMIPITTAFVKLFCNRRRK